MRTFPVCCGLLCMVCVLAGTAQTGDPKISAAPGGVPVPPVPKLVASGDASAEASPLSGVFRVRVLDGRNGAPVARAHLRLSYDEASGAAFILSTNEKGIALMPAPVGTPVRVMVEPDDRVDCRRTQRTLNDPILPTNVASLAETGAVGTNHCGPYSEKPRPGELVLFVRPLRWYEGLNRP